MTRPVVFDTSAIISAAITPNSNAALALEYGFKNAKVLVSTATFEELRRKLTSQKFKKYFVGNEMENLLTRFRELATWIEPETVEAVSRDSEDDMFLAVAKAGDARQIVTLAKDLLVLNPWRGIEILKPYDFLVSVS